MSALIMLNTLVVQSIFRVTDNDENLLHLNIFSDKSSFTLSCCEIVKR